MYYIQIIILDKNFIKIRIITQIFKMLHLLRLNILIKRKNKNDENYVFRILIIMLQSPKERNIVLHLEIFFILSCWG